MENREILALYDWAQGTCFRCAGSGDTTRLQTLTPPAGGSYEVRACRDCLLALETAKRRNAEQHGCRYRPGRLRGRDP